MPFDTIGSEKIGKGRVTSSGLFHVKKALTPQGGIYLRGSRKCKKGAETKGKRVTEELSGGIMYVWRARRM